MFFDGYSLPERRGATLKRPPVPDNGWRPPQSFPNLSSASLIGFDTETKEYDWDHGPGWGRGKVHVVGFSVSAMTPRGDKGSWYFPIRHEVDRSWNLDAINCLGWLDSVLNTPVPKVATNALYDVGTLAEEGVRVGGTVYDVQFAEALLDEEGPTNLDFLGNKYLGRGKEVDVLADWCRQAYGGGKEQRQNIWRSPPQLAGPYAQEDALMPLDILAWQWGELQSQGLVDLMEMECAAIPMLVKMRQHGVRVDLAKTEEIYHELGGELVTLYATLSGLCGFIVAEGVHLPEVCARIFTAAGVPFPQTATGAPSFTKPWMAVQTTPVAAIINKIREYEKLRGTFLRSYILEGHTNGRLHCQFHPLRSDDGGAKTGRYSSSDPNLQNIPARSDAGKRIREAFLPDEGHDCWEKDDHCVSPDTSILTVDMRHVRADSLKPGDELVAFDEETSFRRKLRKTRVRAIRRLREPCYRITTNKGVVVCSDRHRWLAKHRYSAKYGWILTKNLRVGSMIPRVCDVWTAALSYEDGWFGGLLDGEGWRINGLVGFGQNDGPVADRARTYMRANGYEWEEAPGTTGWGKKCLQFKIVGGRRVSWKLLGITRPVRLLERNADFIEGVALQSRTSTPDVVTAIEYLGARDVIAIETDHKTFVANGLMSHNSQIEYRMLANYAVGPGAEALRQEYWIDPTTDYHDRTFANYCRIVGLNLETMSDEEKKKRRRPIKNVNFGLIYGQTEPSLAAAAGMSKDEAARFFPAYHTAAPYVRETMAMNSQEVQALGYMTTVMGRRTRFNRWEPIFREKGAERLPALHYEHALHTYGHAIRRAYDYRATNYRFQGSAADCLKAGMVECWKSGVFDVIGVPLLQVHDELDFSVIDRSPRQEEAYAFMRHTLTHAADCFIRVPLRVDTGRGPNWATAD